MLGTALGAIVVALLLDASWPVRIGVVALVLLVGLAVVVLSARREVGAPAVNQATSGGAGAGQPSSAAYGTNTIDTQGDTKDD